MEAYSVFAEIYDEFMDNIPYDDWEEYISDILKSHGIVSGIVAELGCGTGIMTRRFAKRGYDMIGIDISEEMLLAARENDDAGNILYLNQDMKNLELFGTVNAVISVCDSMNYIMNERELCEVFKKVNNYLEKDGLFIFDIKTLHFYSNILKDSVQTDDRGDVCLIWDNHFDDESHIHTYDLTIFAAVDDEDSTDCEDGRLYEKYTERHYQRAYSVEEIKRALSNAGLELVSVYGELTYDSPSDTEERIYFVAKEGYQDGKYYI